MQFLVENFKIIDVKYLKFSYFHVLGIIGFKNGTFDLEGRDLKKKEPEILSHLELVANTVSMEEAVHQQQGAAQSVET